MTQKVIKKLWPSNGSSQKILPRGSQQSAPEGKLNPDGQLSVPHLKPTWQSLSESQSPSSCPHGDAEVQQLESYGAFAEQARDIGFNFINLITF